MNVCVLAFAALLGTSPGAVWTDLTEEVLVRPDAPDLLGTGPTHLYVGEAGELLVYAAVEAEVLRLDGKGRVASRVPARPPEQAKSRGYEIRKSGSHEGVVEKTFRSRVRWTITTEAELGALHLAGIDRKGRLYVVAEELLSRSPVRVRRTVHLLAREGGELRRWELPPPSPIRVEKEWAVAPEGRFLLLQVSTEQVRVLSWGQP